MLSPKVALHARNLAVADDVRTCENTVHHLLLLSRELSHFAVLHHSIRPCGTRNGYNDAAISCIGVCTYPGESDLRSRHPFGLGEGLNLVNELQVCVEMLSFAH